MESLNYTQLSSAVLALSIFSIIMYVFVLLLAIRIGQIQKDFTKEDRVIYKSIQQLNQHHQELQGRVYDLIESHPKQLAILKTNIYQHLEARFDVLIKPKYEIGDKILCSDNERGVITKIEKGGDNSFWYTFKTRKYFNHPARELRTSEHGIVNKY